MASSSEYRSHPVSVPLYSALLPVLDEMSKDFDQQTINQLKEAFINTEKDVPGFTQEFLNGVINKEAPSQINFTKSLLRMAKQDSSVYDNNRTGNEFVRLSTRAQRLKNILSRIPDEMQDRPRFLQTIKDIASAIKELLDAVNEVFKLHTRRENRKMLDSEKKEFVKCSKNFSDTLKTYFKDGQEIRVFASAIRLIQQANTILHVFRNEP